MWEALGNVFTSDSFLHSIPSVILLIIVIGLAVKLGIIKVKTKYVQIGDESKDSYYERAVVRNQINAAHDYIYSLESKICSMVTEHRYNGYFIKYVLERVYDKVIEWITFNHIEDTEAYISCKQIEMCNIVYSLSVQEEFTTEAFNDRMNKWTAELIKQLVKVRALYKKQGVL